MFAPGDVVVLATGPDKGIYGIYMGPDPRSEGLVIVTWDSGVTEHIPENEITPYQGEQHRTELFIDSAGTHVEIHERNDDCMENGCCIHNPSDHPLRDAPLVWRIVGPFDIKPPHMERFCEHGVGHPDPDSLAFLRRIGRGNIADSLAVHGCCGCCHAA